jgi:hypothetical protein
MLAKGLKPDQLSHDVFAGAVGEWCALPPAHLLEVVPDLFRDPFRQNKQRRFFLRGTLLLCSFLYLFCICICIWGRYM